MKKLELPAEPTSDFDVASVQGLPIRQETDMTTLDYATLYETEFRFRRRRAVWQRILATAVFTLWPLAVVGAMALR